MFGREGCIRGAEQWVRSSPRALMLHREKRITIRLAGLDEHPNWHLRMDLRRVARNVLSARFGARQRARLREQAARFDRSERNVLQAAAAGGLCGVVERCPKKMHSPEMSLEFGFILLSGFDVPGNGNSVRSQVDVGFAYGTLVEALSCNTPRNFSEPVTKPVPCIYPCTAWKRNRLTHLKANRRIGMDFMVSIRTRQP